MKVSIIGGAGVRVPLLVRGLAEAGLGIDEIALFDLDTPRLAAVADLSARVAGAVRVTPHDRPESCLDASAFVIASIRVGGASQRARDEAIALRHGVVAQETVGAVGFAMAIRTIPAMVEYARLTARHAPGAWFITFTNPVSIVTQAVRQQTDVRAIGICDTPYEIFEDAAHALGLPATACRYDYFGLNHLGWLREIYHQGVPQMDRLWNDPARLDAAYRDSLFESSRLRDLRLLPSEYLFYYYRPETALENLRRAGTSRGAEVARLTHALFADLARGVPDPVRRYEAYLAARDASYMRLETGTTTPRVKPAWAELSGYDRIAIMTMKAIVHSTGDVIPLDVTNDDTFPFLRPDDVVEVPCAVDVEGPRALPVPPVPAHCEALMTEVKAYERATIAAALSGTVSDQTRALSMNPLSGPPERVSALVADLVTP